MNYRGVNAEEKLREPELKRDLVLQSNLRVNLCFIVKLDERRSEALLLIYMQKGLCPGRNSDLTHTRRISITSKREFLDHHRET